MTNARKQPKRTKGSDIVSAMMAEHVRLPGCPQIIVTRAYAYQFLVRTGFDPKVKGFGSIDYMVFGQRERTEPLTDLEAIAPFMASLEAAYRRDCGNVEAL